MASIVSPLARLVHLLRDEKKEIYSIYFYALVSGLIQLSLPLGIQSIVGFVLGGALSTSLVLLVVIVVMGVACNGALQINQMKLIERIQEKIFVRYSLLFNHHLLHLNLSKADDYYLPELVNRFFDIPELQKSLSKILLDFPIAATQILLGLLLLMFYHPAFIAFGIVLLVVLLIIFYITGSKGIETSNAKSNYKYAVAAWLEEMARAIRAFKYASQSGLAFRQTDEALVNYIEARKFHFSILLFQYKVLVVFKTLITAAMLIVGVLLLLDQQINIGQFVAAEIIIILVINSVEKLIVDLDSVYSALTSVTKINKLIDKPLETEGNLVLAEAVTEVEFKDVSFDYKGDNGLLCNLSFRIAKGDKVCIAGSNSTGKSTLLRLLTGAYAGFTGAILINGIPIGNYTLASLRSQIGVVQNRLDIFSGNLWNNITTGNPQADPQYIAELCRVTGLSAFIATLPQGFDTEIHPAGRHLPRSVVQRILLVRALSHRPSLLLLEEPATSIEKDDKQSIYRLLLQLPDTMVMAVSQDGAFQSSCNKIIRIGNIQTNKTSLL